MLFSETTIPGVFQIDIEPRHDERGFFARTWSREEFTSRGLCSEFVQCSVSHNAKLGTLRGMHFQEAPCAEAKVVTCLRGAIYDVAVDLRPESPTFCRWAAVELGEGTLRMLYIPEGCAHGFLTLTPDALVHYQISAEYSPQHARGVRWSDPAFDVKWPFEPKLLAERDATFPLFRTHS